MSALLAPSVFAEIAAGMGWLPREVLAMLWHYLDESGSHDAEKGHLRRLTLAGGVATRDAWDAFDADWRAMLDDFGLSEFHMADFEAWAPPFDFTLPTGERDRDRHNALLNRALDLVVEHVDELMGFVAEPVAGKPPFKDAYESNLVKALKEWSIDSYHRQERITMVFARHNEFSGERIGRYFDRLNDGDRLVFGGVGDPKCLPPLQVADIVAYEMSRWARDQRPEPDRYPLRKLKAAFQHKATIKHSRFVLTFL